MNCAPFVIAESGDLICGGSKPDRVGTVRRPPSGLSAEQFQQVSSWVVLRALADAVAPIFAVTSQDPRSLEATVRLRVSAKLRDVIKRVDDSLTDLVNDLREVGAGMGWNSQLYRTRIADPKKSGSFIIWEVVVRTDPTVIQPGALSPALQELARVMQETRLGEHVMDPSAPWTPELGRRYRNV